MARWLAFGRQQRPRYGFYVDHMVDVFGAVALMCRDGVLGVVALADGDCNAGDVSNPGVRELFGDLCAGAAFSLSQGIFGPTEIRLLMIAGDRGGCCGSPYAQRIFGHKMLLFDLGGAIAAATMLAMAIGVTVRNTAELCRQEPLP
jgi:archaetidylinositol phosphate synthase